MVQRNSKAFWLGILISPAMLTLVWALNNKSVAEAPAPAAKTQVSSIITLRTINFIKATAPKSLKDPNIRVLHVGPQEKDSPTPKALSDFQGKTTVLHFWATWCGACVEEMPDLSKFSEKMGENVHFVVIASDHTQGKAVRDFYASKGITNLEIYIDQYNVAKHFDVKAIPTSIFIDKEGQEIGRISGIVDWSGTAGDVLQAQVLQF